MPCRREPIFVLIQSRIQVQISSARAAGHRELELSRPNVLSRSIMSAQRHLIQ